jgi:ubiquinone/menaquinone biosynthesis C-methylase UbiE
MIAYAQGRFRPSENVEWLEADAAALPFSDGSFDAVVCQFGLMFVPEKELAMREAYRVLSSGGVFLFNVWDSLEHNRSLKSLTKRSARFSMSIPQPFTRSRLVFTIPF